MNNLNFNVLEESINIIEVIFDYRLIWDEASLNDFGKYIIFLEQSFNQEIQSNMFGKTRLEKQDIIRTYINNIGEILYNVIWVDYEDDEEINMIVLNSVKDFFQYLIDIICTICYQNNINLPQLTIENPILTDKINLGVYYSIDKENTLNTKTKIQVFESYFLTLESKELFKYLVENFDSNYSNHNKFSCIYRLMIKDGFMDINLKSEHYKILLKSVYKIEDIKFPIKLKDDLSKKIIKHYEHLKNTFLSN